MMRMPCSAPLPVPTMMAVGVASPKAQGQAITNTGIKTLRAKLMSPVAISQAMPAMRAMANTTGTKMPETLSASLAMGALEPWASSTRRMIWASAVSSPTFSARKRREPVVFRVAANTWSPASFITGMLSPVMADSSRPLAPEIITPSTGTRAPGRSRRMSPASTSSTGISRSSSPLRRMAVLGVRASRAFTASPVRPLDTASRVLPSRIRVMMTPADS